MINSCKLSKFQLLFTCFLFGWIYWAQWSYHSSYGITIELLRICLRWSRHNRINKNAIYFVSKLIRSINNSCIWWISIGESVHIQRSCWVLSRGCFHYFVSWRNSSLYGMVSVLLRLNVKMKKSKQMKFQVDCTQFGRKSNTDKQFHT